MRRTFVAPVALMALAMAALTGCSGASGEPGDLYTPTGGLTRELYLAANERWDEMCMLYGVEEMGKPDCADRVKRAFREYHVAGKAAYQGADGWNLTDKKDGSWTRSGDGATLTGLTYDNGFTLTSARMSKIGEYWLVDLD